jgi:hypothetical protein
MIPHPETLERTHMKLPNIIASLQCPSRVEVIPDLERIFYRLVVRAFGCVDGGVHAYKRMPD